MVRFLTVAFYFIAALSSSIIAEELDPPKESPVIPMNQLLTPSNEMKLFIERALQTKLHGKRLLQHISSMLMDEQTLGFTYDSNANLTAAEAFRQRRGNCISFSFMTASLLREAGFTVYFHNPKTPISWNSYQDQWVQETHMNLLVEISNDLYEVDIFSIQKDQTSKPLTDKQAFAHYYSNQGVFILSKGDLEAAEANLMAALDLDKSYSNLWQNLGIYYRRTKEYSKALSCLERAAILNPQNEAIFYLLSKTARRLGDYKKAQNYRKNMQSLDAQSPLYLFACGEDALADEKPEAALDYLQSAIKKLPDCHLFYRSQARAYGMLKNYQKMLDSLQQARDVSTSRKLQRIYTRIMENAVKAIHASQEAR
jgi:tetratricopeptide (TPR) repeat protein